MQTDRYENRIKKKEKREVAVPKMALCLIVAAITTIIFFLRIKAGMYSALDVGSMGYWGIAAFLGGIFVFAFGFTLSVFYFKDHKLTGLSKYTIFLLISVVAGALVTYGTVDKGAGFWDILLHFSLCTGIAFAFFTLFSKIKFEKVTKNIGRFFKCLAYGVLFPSMFLTIALMGKIDSNGLFLPLAKIALIGDSTLPSAGYAVGNAGYKAVESIYNLGRYEYSGIFMVAILVFCLFSSLYWFFKKEKTA